MMLLKKYPVVALVVLLAWLAPSIAVTADGPPDFMELIDADTVMAHVSALSVDIGARPMGSEAEAAAADYITAEFEAYGYEVEVQEFVTTPPWDEKEEVVSRNVIATLEGDDEVIVVGAHMDSVTSATGAGDNATGIAVILAVAEVLAEFDLAHTVVFVAFGAEESGDPPGADVYVESLGDEIENVIAMINIDSVGVGTDLNVYAGAVIEWADDEESASDIEGGEVWVRDLALDLADEMGLPFGTTPDDAWGGYTGDWSDHYAFVLEDVPIAYFEAWQWTDTENPWWGQETADGDVMHTEDDVIENVVPEKVEMAAELVVATTYVIAVGDGE
ncbi:MAG: M20/M25/M40 family metallo-hydrolase [Anaerolineae bacterium]|nr:M20/M25/M40 family metallo-hydrolase [Anaerolineae bacterium]